MLTVVRDYTASTVARLASVTHFRFEPANDLLYVDVSRTPNLTWFCVSCWSRITSLKETTYQPITYSKTKNYHQHKLYKTYLWQFQVTSCCQHIWRDVTSSMKIELKTLPSINCIDWHLYNVRKGKDLRWHAHSSFCQTYSCNFSIRQLYKVHQSMVYQPLLSRLIAIA